ncbi:taste receptor type 1 member 1-like [Saccostrea cucullata]|uniref:taste receptor type 1 member 1-like n=1 Tax=Saccostrea cuccullata TaxID=36930 RepID=UPI002ED0C1AB
MELEAVKWAIRRLNDNNYISGVKIGLIAYPTCQSEQLSGYRAMEIATAIKEKSQNILGIIGATRSSESESVATILSRLPVTISPPMTSYSSTCVSLSDKTRFPNFFRTIYSDHIQIEVGFKNVYFKF